MPSFSNESFVPLVLDASAIINLLGTGSAAEIISLLRTEIFAERIAFEEVLRHPIPGADHAAELEDLAASGLLLVQDMDDAGREIFRDLAFSDLTSGLDDGEAATIAFALTHSISAVPVIDERKAASLFLRRWGSRVTISTITLLSDERVTKHLSRARLADAVYSALIHARMRVPRDARTWVDGLLGPDRAAQCSSLSNRAQRTG